MFDGFPRRGDQFLNKCFDISFEGDFLEAQNSLFSGGRMNTNIEKMNGFILIFSDQSNRFFFVFIGEEKVPQSRNDPGKIATQRSNIVTRGDQIEQLNIGEKS